VRQPKVQEYNVSISPVEAPKYSWQIDDDASKYHSYGRQIRENKGFGQLKNSESQKCHHFRSIAIMECLGNHILELRDLTHNQYS
jgi:hypothetical protein